MTTMAQITEGLTHFDPLHKKACPRCGAAHERVDFLCEGCRTKQNIRSRGAGLKGHRTRAKMAAARAADPVDAPGDSNVMLRALLSKVGIREAGPDVAAQSAAEGMKP